MNTQITAIEMPTLPASIGQWRAVYWEPVMQTGERICVGFLTTWAQKSKAVLTVRPDLLVTLFGAAGQNAQNLLERSFRIINARLHANNALNDIALPVSGLHLGSLEVCHANAYGDLLQVAKLMSSSLSTLAEPDNPDTADTLEERPEQGQPARQFATRVRELVSKRDMSLAGYFNKDAALMSSRRLTRFGFLSDSLVAHFGLLQPSNIRNSVRMTRGLITELSLAERASGRKSLLILGFPPLGSPNLTDKERRAIEDYTEELGLEAQEFKLGFAGTDNDTAACDALMAAMQFSVSAELVQLDGRIGRDILQRQQSEGQGAKVIDRLSLDLKDAFAEMRGWLSSKSNTRGFLPSIARMANLVSSLLTNCRVSMFADAVGNLQTLPISQLFAQVFIELRRCFALKTQRIQ